MSKKNASASSNGQPDGRESQLLNRREFLYLTGTVAVAAVITGCGGGGGGGGGTPIDTDFFRSSNVVVKDDVVVLPTDGTLTISNVTDDSLTLSGTIPALAIGAVIVSGEGAGLIRKITSITPSGADTVVGTEGAALTDVFASASIQFQQGLRPEHIQEIQILAEDVQVDAPLGRGRAETDFHITIPKTFIGVPVGDRRLGVDLAAEGNLTLSITGDIDITLANGLEKFEVIQGASWTGTYSASLKGDGTIAKKELPFATFIFSPVFLGFAGPVPLVLLPVLFLQIAAGGTVSAGWEVSGNGTAGYQAGLRYVQNPLGSDFELADVAPIGSASHTGEFLGPSFFGSFKFEVVPLQADLQTSLDGLIGPSLKVDVPGFGVNVKSDSDSKITVDAEAVFKGKVGSKAGLLGEALPEFSITLVEEKIPFYHEVFEPGDGDIEVRSP